ncbi:MAG: hypothetical protein Q4B82_07335 [Alysiella sp.]|uniref:hypothetical protein n=1 Tax=Alysiella sp. TaxID=1872483 RepID=UPI0026DD3713|nr:hypothetical protein [Alysiella sp.]MDO4434374.1 hypothetical protein [Alysiella sp.]
MSNVFFSNTDEGAMVLTDNGAGQLLHGGKLIGGSVDYGTGEIHIPHSALLREMHEPLYTDYQITKGASTTYAVFDKRKTDNVSIVGASGTVSRIVAPDTRDVVQTVQTGQQTYDILQNKPAPCSVLLNSWVFEIGGIRTIERNGVLYQNFNHEEGTGKVVGSLNVSGSLKLNGASLQGSREVKILQGVWVSGDYQVKQFHGRTQLAPIKPQSFTVYTEHNGQTLTGKAQANETLSGNLSGKIETATGYFEIIAPEPISPDSLRYNAVAQSTIPLDSTIIGINANRLPLDGKVPIFRKGDMIVIGNTQEQDIGSAHIAGQSIELQRKNLDRLCVLDADGKHINAELYDENLKAGTMTWATPLDLSQYKMPLKTKQIWEEENRITDVDVVSGSLKLQFGVSRDYPVENTFVSSAVLGGNMEVRATQPFSQQAWTNVWQDTRIGEPILANLNVADYPIVLTSDGAITERWLLKFKNTTQFQLFGERLGLVAESDIYSDLAPINPATNKPYFRLPALAMGGGFAVQNCVRFNTTGTPLPVWVLRAVQPSAKREIQRDGFAVCLRGNAIEL